MVWVILLALLVMPFCALWLLWNVYRLLRRKDYSVLAGYKGAKPDQFPSLAMHHSFALSACAIWLLLLPVAIFKWQIGISHWGPLILVVAGVLTVSKRVIERKHGIKHS